MGQTPWSAAGPLAGLFGAFTRLTPALLLAFFLIAQDKPAEKCALSGTVTDSATGVLLNKVHILIEPLDKSEGPIAVAGTDAKGSFSLVEIDPGKYRVKAIRNGYLDTYYGARRADSTGTVVTLDAGQELKDLQVKLLPYAVIAGTIRDPDGEPVEGAAVMVQRLVYQNGQRDLEGHEEILTDDLGQYRAANLTPGKYYVEVRPKEQFDFHPPINRSSKTSQPIDVLLAAAYPGVQDRASAKAVEVTAGARVTGIDITLPRGHLHTVAGKVALPAGIVANIQIHRPDSSLGDAVAWARNVQGDFEIRGVPPGSYVLRAWAETPVKLSDADRDYSAEIPLTVENSDIAGLKVAFEPNPEVTGHVTIEGEKPITLHNGRVISYGNGNPGVEIDRDNDFLSQFRAGHYVVGVTGDELDDGLVIKSIRLEQADILRSGLTLSPGAKVKLEVVLAPDGGQIEGTALDKDDKPVAGATIVAAPEAGLRTRPDRFYQASTDQNGRYQLKNVAPGEYKLLAWDDVEPGIWFDPDFLRDIEARGQTVSLDAKGHKIATIHLLGSR